MGQLVNVFCTALGEGEELIDSADQNAYDELCAYTLTHTGPAFLHQHVIDAYAAQNATAHTTPLQLSFAVAGLYLHVERGFSGREVQRAHRTLSQRARTWPSFTPPADRGGMTVLDVLANPPGPVRDAAIDAWCAAVWLAYQRSGPVVVAFLEQYSII
jgi:hypothetical protein